MEMTRAEMADLIWKAIHVGTDYMRCAMLDGKKCSECKWSEGNFCQTVNSFSVKMARIADGREDEEEE